MLTWLLAFQKKARVALYCSDVSGAFDKVRTSRLLRKLRAKGMPEQLVCMIMFWLRERTGEVVVTGARSVQMLLSDMVFQGTVLGSHFIEHLL